MKKNIFLINFLWLAIIIGLAGCSSKPEINRPRDPWVFRSVLDKQARMVTVALNENLYVAYDAKTGSLYKAWKGGVNFDGAVYTSVHGPQPTSKGYAYYTQIKNAPVWKVTIGEKEILPDVNFKGYRFRDNQVTFNRTLEIGDTIISLTETPEYIVKDGNPGLWRRFTTENVPAGMQVILSTSLTSMEDKEGFETNGEFLIDSANIEKHEAGQTTTLHGSLLLNSNGATDLKIYFHPGFEPTEEEPVMVAPEGGDLERGQTLIENSDCKACHNETKKTVGPAYMAVAERYSDSEATVSNLVEKVIEGGSGKWGEAVMNPHPDLIEEDARLMVRYILSLAGEETEEEDEAITLGLESIPLNLDKESEHLKVKDKEELYQGLAVSLYTFENRDVPFHQISKQFAPTMTGVAPMVHVTSQEGFGPVGNNIYLEFKGFLHIKESNNYLFRLVNDDGAFLYINGDEIIANGGDHGPEPKDGEIFLEEGLHAVEIDFHQGAGDGMISFQWAKHGTQEFTLVPNDVLVHKKEQFIDVPPYVPVDKLVRSIPGDRKPLQGVHPSFDLSQARPPEFHPRVGGMDFLSDGRLVVCTWDSLGPAYILDGVAGNDPSAIDVKRIASGLAEPLGLKVVDDTIYVLQKQELTQLIDHDGDDIIDEYRTVCDGWKVSANFHEFAFGLVYKDGYFYATLATAIEPGGASSDPQIPDRGKVVKISKEDGSFELIAHGLRTPNGVGIGADNEIFITDNQGDWLPASKLVHLQEGAFYGSRSVNFEGTANLEVTSPVVWLPQDEIGNSPSQPTYLNVGPYQGQMLHGEVTLGGLKRVFVEKVNNGYQGAVFRFTQGLEAGINRLTWGPDGSLYVGGIGSTGNWVHAGKLWYGLQRLSYNEKPTFEMLAVSARSNGMEITLTAPIEEKARLDAESFEVQQWYYQPTAEYGGPKMELENLPIKSVHLSEDRRKIFLELEGMEPEHVVYIRISKPFLSNNEQSLWSTEAWYTLNEIPENKPGFVNSVPAISDNTLTEKEKEAGWKLLFDGKSTKGWRNFNSDETGAAWKVANGNLYLDNSRLSNGQTSKGGDIITEKVYEDFELYLEWKGERGGNSGIIYNVVEDDIYEHVWETGPEMQLLDNVNHPDGRIEKHRSGDLYDLIESTFVTVSDPGEWNSIRIISKDGHVEHWQNGYKIVEYEMHTPEWEEMVRNSKFKDMPDFGKATKGHIALQDHGDKMWFKNIKIRKR